jgi:hypothetical protein
VDSFLVPALFPDKLVCFSTHTDYELDKIRSEVIRKELEISGIQDMRSKHKQNWINYLENMDSTRLPKHALDYKPRGRRDRGRPRKRWQCVDAGTGQTIKSTEGDDDDGDDDGRLRDSCRPVTAG